MGFLDGLFEKKRCAICDKELGRIFGKRKLEDGTICVDCEAKLSPFFDDRRGSTVQQIREQLEYRAQNKEALASFNPTRTIDADDKVMIDEPGRCFVVTSGGSNWRERNPDIIPFDAIIGCEVNVNEHKEKIEQPEEAEQPEAEQNEQANELKNRIDRSNLKSVAKSMSKTETEAEAETEPEYRYSYDINVKLNVNHPYFDHIRIDVTPSSIDAEEVERLKDAEYTAYEIRYALTGEPHPAPEVAPEQVGAVMNSILGTMFGKR